MKAFKSTMLHVVELIALLLVIYGIKVFFDVDSTFIQDAVLVILAAVVKYARSSESVPVKDYVNQ